MRKSHRIVLISALLALLLCLPAAAACRRGDLDGDGKMTLHDVLFLCFSLGNGKPYNGIADIDKNGTNDIQDALKLLAQIVK